MQHGRVAPRFRRRAFPVGTAHIGHGIVAAMLILVPVRILEPVRDRVAGRFGGRIGVLVERKRDRVTNERGAAFGIHAAFGAFGRVTLLGKEVVHRVMRVLGGGQIVIAVYDHVGVRAVLSWQSRQAQRMPLRRRLPCCIRRTAFGDRSARSPCPRRCRCW